MKQGQLSLGLREPGLRRVQVGVVARAHLRRAARDDPPELPQHELLGALGVDADGVGGAPTGMADGAAVMRLPREVRAPCTA